MDKCDIQSEAGTSGNRICVYKTLAAAANSAGAQEKSTEQTKRSQSLRPLNHSHCFFPGPSAFFSRGHAIPFSPMPFSGPSVRIFLRTSGLFNFSFIPCLVRLTVQSSLKKELEKNTHVIPYVIWYSMNTVVCE